MLGIVARPSDNSAQKRFLHQALEELPGGGEEV